MIADTTLPRESLEEELSRLSNRLEHDIRSIWYELWSLTYQVGHLAWPAAGWTPDTVADERTLQLLKDVRGRLSRLPLDRATGDAQRCVILGSVLHREAA